MLSLAVFASALVLVSSSCCTPTRWNAYQSMVTGAKSDDLTKPYSSLTEAAYTINVDSVRKMVSVVGGTKTNDDYYMTHVLSDYANDVEYVVTNGTCQKGAPRSEWPGNCLPDNATVTGHAFLGMNANAANVTQYRFDVRGVTVYMSVTSDCIPISEIFYGHANGSYVFGTIAFTNVHPGLQDNTVFNLPSECGQLTPTINGGIIVGRRQSYFH